MTKGDDIEYAIFKSVSEYGLDVWLETWEISRADWDKFITAGKSAFSDTQAEAEIIHEEKNLLEQEKAELMIMKMRKMREDLRYF